MKKKRSEKFHTDSQSDEMDLKRINTWLPGAVALNGQLVRRRILGGQYRMFNSGFVARNNDPDDISLLFDNKKNRRRKVYKRLNTIVRKELQSKFDESREKQLLSHKNLKIKYNPKEVGDFSSFGVTKTLTQAVKDAFPSLETASPDQSKILAVLKSHISCFARTSPGSGSSLSGLVYAMDMRRRDIKSVDSIILVPTTQLVKQYQRYSERLLNEYKWDKRGKVQFLYRSSKEEEQTQIQNLEAITPQTIVTTPQRLLDVISEHVDDPNYMKINCVRFIALDELDSLLLKTSGHTKPAEILIDYVNRLRGTVVNNPPLQFLFIDSIDHSLRLDRLIEDKEWCVSRNFVSVGSPPSKSDIIPRPSIPSNVLISLIVSDTKTGDKDVRLQAAVDIVEAMKRLRANVEIEFDKGYKLYRLKSRNGVEANLVELVRAIPRMKLSQDKTLCIVPEGASIPRLLETFAQNKLSAQWIDDVDLHKFFDEPGEAMLLLTPSSITGVSFPGLRNIICLGVDSVSDFRTLTKIATRCRLPKTGLLRDHTVGDKDLEPVFSCKLTLMMTRKEFGMMERFALERVLLQSGLQRLTPVIGDYEEVDLGKYQELVLSFTDGL